MSPSLPPLPTGPRPSDGTARVRWAAETGVGQLDGGWWPRTRDVARELQQLLDATPAGRGRVSRVSLCSRDWPLPHPTRAQQRGRTVKVGWFEGMEPHTVSLGSSSRGTPRTLLLVVPEGATPAEAEDDLAAACTPTTRRATQLLADSTRS
ncbi:MAG: hypothetical protein JWM64_2504 [Frankiales bacterium]|nr:hypothetical protein [Frankiales bacterium]